eukprot:7381710-Prymnesium_polylepis.4
MRRARAICPRAAHAICLFVSARVLLATALERDVGEGCGRFEIHRIAAGETGESHVSEHKLRRTVGFEEGRVANVLLKLSVCGYDEWAGCFRSLADPYDQAIVVWRQGRAALDNCVLEMKFAAADGECSFDGAADATATLDRHATAVLAHCAAPILTYC